MGIPFFFSSLVSRHDLVIPLPASPPDVLAFDYNCLIHTVAQAVARVSQATTETQLHRDVFKGIVAYTADIIQAVKPGRVYVAIDGVPPVAKLVQQRKRRYMAAMERDRKSAGRAGGGGTAAAQLWSSNTVTPGTAFMQKLHTHLGKELPKLSPGLEFSSWDEPGEGEHKIFRWLAADGEPARGNNRGEGGSAPHKTVMIYGMDADMILLSMMHSVHPKRQACDVVLLRERQDALVHRADEGQPRGMNIATDFDVVSIQRVMAAVLPRLGARLDSRTAVLNYVLLAALMGNDFLPPLSYLRIRAAAGSRAKPGMERLMEVAAPLLGSGSGAGPGAGTGAAQSFARWDASDTTGCHVDFAALRSLIAELASTEDQRMKEAYGEYLRPPPRRPSPGDSDADHRWKYLPLMMEEHREVRLVDPSRPGWRMQYNAGLFPRGTDPESVLREYTAGVEWVMRYYITNTAPQEEWMFPYCYSPTAQALHHFLLKNAGKQAVLDSSYRLPFELTPEVQLLAVTPPGSKAILSAAQRRVMEDVNHRFMFPDSFRLHTWLKGVSWECTPQLPPMDLRRLHAALQRAPAAKKSIKKGSADVTVTAA
ncbi:hypothetical protein HXX76_014040 [Chlamydomonas incerta]|uniref:Xrn1 N-terminal domain-containing protein n=1 Tax=Chlamydomonas incerta TaxID=51695 RepID=A0A835SCR5_CHLIN|nr:hypothetical protein HXX76_014040 [Chlamydomonas incerta]|eukprot:KAG2424882.1 hypothetical protein HXX76_014040 [Chlamydomonas incerta]